MSAPGAKLQPDSPTPKPELVAPAPATSDHAPEQLPLIRMLEIVRDRVESIHASQHTIEQQLKNIAVSLPVQRKPLSRRSQELHIRVIAARRNGLCPCCQTTPVCTELGRMAGSEFDHWYSRNQNRVTQTWLVCAECNQKLLDTDFKSSARSSFESYQLALRPFQGGRQTAFGFSG